MNVKFKKKVIIIIFSFQSIKLIMVNESPRMLTWKYQIIDRKYILRLFHVVKDKKVCASIVIVRAHANKSKSYRNSENVMVGDFYIDTSKKPFFHRRKSYHFFNKLKHNTAIISHREHYFSISKWRFMKYIILNKVKIFQIVFFFFNNANALNLITHQRVWTK